MKNSRKIAIAAVAMCAAMAVGGISAYFTDTDQKVNEFNVGDVHIKIEEPHWPPEDESVPDVPNKETAKDPQVVNVGKNSAYIFAKIAVPKDTFIAADDDGTRLTTEPQLQELFTVKSGDGEFASLEEGYNKNDWELLTDYVDKTTSADFNFYVFGCKRIISKEDRTEALFDTVKLANATENTGKTEENPSGIGIEDKHYDINVNAYAIQSENIPNGETDLSKIYEIYLNQNDKPAKDAGEEQGNEQNNEQNNEGNQG